MTEYIKTCKNCGEIFEHPVKEFCSYDCVVEFRTAEAKRENKEANDGEI